MSTVINGRAASIICVGLAFPLRGLGVGILRKGAVFNVSWLGVGERSCKCDDSKNEECHGLHIYRLVVEELRKCWEDWRTRF